MLEFVKYPPPSPDQIDPPMCSVTYPKCCGWIAEGEVWALPFCRAHGEEAAQAAKIEVHEDAGRELGALLTNTDGERFVQNPLLRKALGKIEIPGGDDTSGEHEEAIAAAYAPDDSLLDSETLAFDYADEDRTLIPYDWWCEARELVVKWMREAHEAGQSPLLDALEPIRERASVQQVLAARDLERRWAAPRRAEREERRRREAGSLPAG